MSGSRITAVLVPAAIALTSASAPCQTVDAVSATAAQSPGVAATDAGLATPTGHEVALDVGGYSYVEPGALRISIHGAKFGGEYAGTRSLDRRRQWFAQADVRGTVGRVTYDGWCSPFLIMPNSDSPNGYELDEGDPSPCSETGEQDWYVEARALVGRDVIAHNWGLSPETGLGVRHVSNGLTGVAGYRTDDYLYLPVGVTARTMVTSHRAVSFTLEYDRLLRGWQRTRDSKLGGGDIPATATAPGFTIDGFTDVAFDQHAGWALRASAKIPVTRHWSVEPAYIHWNVSASPVNDETVTFTVNTVSAQERLGFYEPLNTTGEFLVKLGFHF
jgi:hypothetical protein